MTHGHHASGAAAAFVASWTLMMAAMMLPSLAPALWRFHRAAISAGTGQPALRTALVGAAYLGVWSVAGAAAFALGAAPALHLAPALVVLLAGAVQLSPWKTHRLDRCRAAACAEESATAAACAAWRHGLRLGVRCVESCAAPTAALLAVGAM